MRTLATFLAPLLFAVNLLAQNQQQYAPPPPPVQQTQAPVDCYTRNLDNGNAALRRGETREALRYFNEAKNCPEAQKNARRQSEIATQIERGEAQLGIKKMAESEGKADKIVVVTTQKRAFSNEAPVTRRNYKADRNFLKDTLDDCFQRMVGEADRAFGLQFWEDAAALYRAAKNCTNADQNDRQKMTDKINACRNAAENALFAKQQEAERQARHAIAANLADDAQELLQTSDRTLAFRLADFANQYIAPDDNPDCVQAIFDAWYYQPSETAKHQEDVLYRPVFCYELANDLGENTQLKFRTQKDGSQWLWSFVPGSGDMFAWEMPSMRLVQSYGTGEGNDYAGFDFAPDGELIFWGNKFFDLRRGSRSVRIDVPRVGNWCFNKRGDEFFFENKAEGSIMVFNVREAFAQQNSRKGSKNTNNYQIPVLPREIITEVPEGLLALDYLDGKFWLGYRDRVEILSKNKAGDPWRREKIIRFEDIEIPDFVDPSDLRLQMFPSDGFATLSYNTGLWTIPLLLKEPANASEKSNIQYFENTIPLAISPAKRQLASQYSGNYLSNAFWVLDATTGDTMLRQTMPSNTEFEPLRGAYSADNHWVAVATTIGSIYLWALQDAPTIWSSTLAHLDDQKPLFSPDGTRVFVTYSDTLMVMNTSSSPNSELLWKNAGQALRGSDDHWALVQISSDSAEARHLTDGRRLKFPLKNPGIPYLYAFDALGEKMVAYLSDWNKVEVRSLKTGVLIASRTFEGGAIGAIQFVPGSDQLMVVQFNAMGESINHESSVKLWSPWNGKEKPRALRLHGYSVGASALDATGVLAGFSDGKDIRIFNLQNIENEVLKIRAAADESVKAIAFQPGSNLVAAAYSTGKVVFWNTQTGQAALQLQVVPKLEMQMGVNEITNIGFSQNGAILHIAFENRRLLAFLLDPSSIRAVAQDENRQLQSFSTKDILEYNLEAALNYPGNFERLAESGDAPLLRSFFRYFSNQALESNNILQVHNYCERAFYLYARLEKNTQQLWKTDISVMYEDYARKLLLRGNIAEATKVIAVIKQQFKTEPSLLTAHIALLKRDYPKAAELYSKYLLINDFDGSPLPYGMMYHFDWVEKDLAQFQDYELLDSAQANCFCSTVRYSGAFSTFCPLGKDYSGNFLSNIDQAHWQIAQKRNAASSVLRQAEKTKLLKEAHQKAQEIVRNNPAQEQVWLETITVDLALAERNWGVFEQNTPETTPHFEKAIQLLTEMGPFKKLSDTSRLALIASTRLAWGRHLLEIGKPTEALQQLNQGLEAAQPLSEIVFESDTTLLTIYYQNLVGPLYEKMGKAFLLLGYTEEARQAYDRAGIYFSTNGLNSLYLANVAALEGDRIQAFLDYGGISNSEQAGESLFYLNLLTEKFPGKRAQLDSLATDLTAALRSSKKQKINPDEADYAFAKLKTSYFSDLTRWDSAAYWGKIAMDCAKRNQGTSKEADTWTLLWLDEHVNVPFYLLMGAWNKPEALEACIQYSESAETFVNDGNLYFGNRELLKTNLGHALILRNKPGDREKALNLYRVFIDAYADPRGYDNRDLLEKDIRELKRLGAPWPEMPELEMLLKG